MARKDSTASIYTEDDRETKSLNRAVAVITYLKKSPGEPVPVQEIAEAVGSYYEEVLHVATTLEALAQVQRYKRSGSPREGARIAYAWREQPSKARNRRSRETLRKKTAA
jgi:hypothetical protein